MDPDRSAQGRDPHTQYDLRHIFLSVGRAILEHLITRTALGCDLEARRSAQRFELDTYHGDALPTELRGRILSCLTWGSRPRAPNSGPHSGPTGSALGIGERTALREPSILPHSPTRPSAPSRATPRTAHRGGPSVGNPSDGHALRGQRRRTCPRRPSAPARRQPLLTRMRCALSRP